MEMSVPLGVDLYSGHCDSAVYEDRTISLGLAEPLQEAGVQPGKLIRFSDRKLDRSALTCLPNGRTAHQRCNQDHDYERLQRDPAARTPGWSRQGIRVGHRRGRRCARFPVHRRARLPLHSHAKEPEVRLAGSGPLDVKLEASLESGDGLAVRYDGHDLATIASEDLENGPGPVEVL
jgi:hypothetical protein